MIARILAILSFIFVITVSSSAPVFAFQAFSGVCNGGTTSKSAVCTDSKSTTDPVAGRNGLLEKATNLIAIVAGVAAIVVILIGSINYIVSDGDSQKITNARNMVVYALVGIAVIAIVRTIVVYVINQVSS